MAYQARRGLGETGGARFSSSKVTTSQASCAGQQLAQQLVVQAWPERNAL
jgi:hypothetical protein